MRRLSSPKFLIVWGLLGAVLTAGVIGFALSTSGGQSAHDWNPNPACKHHEGVQSATSSSGALVAVICKDGTLVKNPY